MKKLILLFIIPSLSISIFSQRLTVNFDFDKSQLDESSKTELIEFVKANNPPELTLEGYADTVGTVQYNKTLVQQRLNAVETFIQTADKSIVIKKVNFGEEASPLHSLGYRKVDIILPQTYYRSTEPIYKKPQSYLVNNKNDTIIKCKSGTVIKIPKDSFVLKDTKETPRGSIELQVTEYYELPEMIAANLSTQSGNKMLETGGMLFIEAYSDNKECVIGNKQGIGISFKGITEKDSMHVFTGVETEKGVDWELLNAEILVVESESVYFIVEEMPEFPGGDAALNMFISSQIRYPVIAQENGIEGRVYVSFLVDESGYIKNPKIARGVNKYLDSEALRVLSLSPRWKPGKHKGKAVSVSYTIPINFVLNSGIPIDSSNTLISEAGFNTLEQNDSVYQEYQKKYEVVNEFFLRTSKLGWINCDKFYRYTSKRNIKIRTKKMSDNYYAIFNKSRSIMRPNAFASNQKTIGFNGIPSNQEITIVGFKIDNDESFFTSFKAESNKDIYAPTFEKIDKNELVHKMKELGL